MGRLLGVGHTGVDAALSSHTLHETSSALRLVDLHGKGSVEVPERFPDIPVLATEHLLESRLVIFPVGPVEVELEEVLVGVSGQGGDFVLCQEHPLVQGVHGDVVHRRISSDVLPGPVHQGVQGVSLLLPCGDRGTGIALVVPSSSNHNSALRLQLVHGLLQRLHLGGIVKIVVLQGVVVTEFLLEVLQGLAPLRLVPEGLQSNAVHLLRTCSRLREDMESVHSDELRACICESLEKIGNHVISHKPRRDDDRVLPLQSLLGKFLKFLHQLLQTVLGVTAHGLQNCRIFRNGPPVLPRPRAHRSDY
mmetsp:Transcript_15036/g.30413  ORF Transcript_15036/g.30413 Transcript_15036/m.30413 type:complete len:306 (-) Transcript_15036:241-1158(-)